MTLFGGKDYVMFHGRRAASIENDHLRVTVLHEGGHIAEIADKASGLNPLWIPHWPGIEPSTYTRDAHPEYGAGADGSLLAGIMGHSLCLDVFGGPSAEEEAAGLPVHGETSVASFSIDRDGTALTMHAVLADARLRIERGIALEDRLVRVRESVENLAGSDRPVGWTEHVTLGPPFLEKGRTEFRAPATRSKVFDGTVGSDDALVPGAEFDWPLAPRADGGRVDLRVYPDAPASSGYTAHLLDPSRERAFFVAFSPTARLAFGYAWRRADFPWLGIWQENHSRQWAPWNRGALTCGLEFGVSPMPETRRQMIERGRLFGTPTFRWIPARTRVEVEYCATLFPAAAVPESIDL